MSRFTVGYLSEVLKDPAAQQVDEMLFSLAVEQLSMMTEIPIEKIRGNLKTLEIPEEQRVMELGWGARRLAMKLESAIDRKAAAKAIGVPSLTRITVRVPGDRHRHRRVRRNLKLQKMLRRA